MEWQSRHCKVNQRKLEEENARWSTEKTSEGFAGLMPIYIP